MSSLNPGGNRSTDKPRAFTPSEVKRACEKAKIAEVDKPSGSIATLEHTHSREVARRLRQAARKNR